MLRCVSPYRAVVSDSNGDRIISFEVGDTVDDTALAAWLLHDAPAAFEAIEPEARALDAAPQDRMLKTANRRTAKPRTED